MAVVLAPHKYLKNVFWMVDFLVDFSRGHVSCEKKNEELFFALFCFFVFTDSFLFHDFNLKNKT